MLSVVLWLLLFMLGEVCSVIMLSVVMLSVVLWLLLFMLGEVCNVIMLSEVIPAEGLNNKSLKHFQTFIFRSLLPLAHANTKNFCYTVPAK